MASDGIKVRIDTEADTSGAEAAAASIEGLQTTAEEAATATDSLASAEQAEAKAQAAADVERAKALRSQREQAAVIKQIEANMRAMLATQAASTVADIARQFKDLGAAGAGASAALDSLSAGMATFVATGNPVAAVATAIVSSLGSVTKLIRDYNAEMKLSEKAHDNAAKAARRFEESRASLAREVRAEQLADTFAEEARQQQAAVKAIERRNRVAAATREAEAQIAAAKMPLGTSATAAAGEGMIADVTSRLVALDENLKLFAAQAESSALAASQAETALREAEREGATNERFRELQQKMLNSRAEADAAYEDLKAEQEIAAKQREAILAGAKAATDEGKILAEAARDIVAQIEAMPPAERTTATRQALTDLQTALVGGIDASELNAVRTAVEQLKNSRSEADNAIVAALMETIRQQNYTRQRVEALQSQIADAAKK